MRFSVAVALLFLEIVTHASQHCQEMARPLLEEKSQRNSRFWDTLLHRQRIFPKIETTILDAVVVSPKTKAVLRALEEAGGEGRFERVDLKDSKRRIKAVRVLSPPQNNLYGSAFNKVFRELEANNIPVFIDPHIIKDMGVGGYNYKEGFGPDKKAAFFIGAKGGNLIAGHELRHIRDFIMDYEQYKRALPEASEKLFGLLNRMMAGEKLHSKEYKILKAATDLEVNLGEIRASEESLKKILTREGRAEIWDDKTWHWEMFMYFIELANASTSSVRFFLNLRRSELSYPHKLKMASKMVLFLAPLPVILGLVSGTYAVFVLM